MRILVIEPGRAPYEKELRAELSAMQELVGGPIQAVYPFEEPVALICSEEGKLQGLPLSRALREPDTGKIYDIVSGTFFLCGAPEDGENFESLTEEQVRRYREVFAVPELFLNLGGQLVVLPGG